MLFYQYAPTPFGEVLIASTSKGIVHLAFLKNRKTALKELKERFPEIDLKEKVASLHTRALRTLVDPKRAASVPLDLQGTALQLAVWRALVRIPVGQVTTYGQLAAKIGKPKAARAVASVVGQNRIAVLVPCHRVILSSGALGQYAWGSERKMKLLRAEQKTKESA